AWVPHVLANEAIPALMPAHVQRAEYPANNGSHGAVGAAPVYPQARPDDDDVDQDRVTHELGFANRTEIGEDQPQADENDYSPREHAVALQRTMCCRRTPRAPTAQSAAV